MFEIIEYGDFMPSGKQKKKKQIILSHTSREVGEYLSSIKFSKQIVYLDIRGLEFGILLDMRDSEQLLVHIIEELMELLSSMTSLKCHPSTTSRLGSLKLIDSSLKESTSC